MFKYIHTRLEFQVSNYIILRKAEKVEKAEEAAPVEEVKSEKQEDAAEDFFDPEGKL